MRFVLATSTRAFGPWVPFSLQTVRDYPQRRNHQLEFASVVHKPMKTRIRLEAKVHTTLLSTVFDHTTHGCPHNVKFIVDTFASSARRCNPAMNGAPVLVACREEPSLQGRATLESTPYNQAKLH